MAMECTEQKGSVDIGVQCNLIIKAYRSVDTDTAVFHSVRQVAVRTLLNPSP